MRCWYPQCSDSNPTQMKMICRVCLHLKCRLKNCWCFWNKSVCWRTGLNSAWKHFHIHLRSVDSLYSSAAGSRVMAFWLNFCFKDLNILAESLPERFVHFSVQLSIWIAVASATSSRCEEQLLLASLQTSQLQKTHARAHTQLELALGVGLHDLPPPLK